MLFLLAELKSNERPLILLPLALFAKFICKLVFEFTFMFGTFTVGNDDRLFIAFDLMELRNKSKAAVFDEFNSFL